VSAAGEIAPLIDDRMRRSHPIDHSHRGWDCPGSVTTVVAMLGVFFSLDTRRRECGSTR